MNSLDIISSTETLDRKRYTCSQCSLVDLCLPMGLDNAELTKLEQLIQQSQRYRENDFLFRQGDAFHAIYAVRSGTFKSYTIDHEGNEHILSFHLPGELVGLDAIYHQHYPTNMMALEAASICTVPYLGLMELSEQIPSLQRQLLRLLSKEINNVHALAHDISADQRLAVFICGLSARHEQRGYSATHFNLSMPRRDIANHLNMAPETISRSLKKMQDQGMIQLNKRELTISNLAALKSLAACQSC